MNITNTIDKEFCISVANTINQQILATVASKWVYLSWGVSKKFFCEIDNMPGLLMRVSGAIHKGWVAILLNEGSDTYEVRLYDVQKNLKSTNEDIYCDELGSVIDTLIERGTDSMEEYAKRAMQDSVRKMAS